MTDFSFSNEKLIKIFHLNLPKLSNPEKKGVYIFRDIFIIF